MHNEKLIELVRYYSFLYNQEDKSYSDNDKKDAAWKEIGKMLNEPAKHCKKQWNSLRDSFRRSLRKRKDTKSGQAANKIRKWRYEDEMSFLIPYMKERETITSVQVHVSDESNDELDDVNTTEDNSNLIERSSSSKVSDIPIETFRRKMKREPATAVLMDYASSNTNRTVNEEQQTMDDIDLFFKSIALTVKKLSPYNQIIAKARVSSVISELQIQELSNTNRQHFSSESLNSSAVSTPTPSPCTLESLQTINPQQPTNT
ncbi:uncharacterized protein LOC126915783 [Bombus affinis]|uniref:Uncharacterized protein LOC100649135 n=1 Tax=Bombus terrestris TaxID=30195 RepID=A0A9B0BY45_BOMTE|nr:uncharacterized protein LOC100649135 [Bombus terrestris]XP_043583991.1 uncharacterized protein LOC122568376 [Bombus pyrosoma]XP_050492122.1 uncharacterized protein LOC126874297 [Bombus huntii]XP_050576750.1 uncharacterized protein LOC126915783 [Bombus affinis]